MDPKPIATASITDDDETFTPDPFDQWLDGEIGFADLTPAQQGRARRILAS